MNRILRLFVALVFIGVAVPAVAASDHDKLAIQRVIQAQLSAFEKDDGATAFGFSTPGLRARFHDSANFMKMVRENYGPVYRPSQISFGALEEVEGVSVQHVLTVGLDGNTHEALFIMERQRHGTWLIAGCYLLDTDLTPT